MLAGTWSWNPGNACVEVDLIADRIPATVRRQVAPFLVADVGDEAVDALILLMSIVNRCGIDLEGAFRTKEARNESRVWL
jgi:hypothetical protein